MFTTGGSEDIEMAKDIIADNQTAAAISKLRRGEATDSLRDEVSAALLSSVQTIIAELDEMKRSMWTPQALRNAIDDRHNALCSGCPTRAWVEAKKLAENAAALSQKTESKGKTSWLVEIVKSESLRYFILILLLVWAVIYIKTGVDGMEAVKSGMTHTITGGVK